MKLIRGGIFVTLSLFLLIGLAGMGCTEQEKTEQTGMAVSDSEGPAPPTYYITSPSEGQSGTITGNVGPKINLMAYLVKFTAPSSSFSNPTTIKSGGSITITKITAIGQNPAWPGPMPATGIADQPVSVVVTTGDTEVGH